MRTKFQQIGKISLSAVLSIVTVFSTVFCGSFYTVTAETAAAEILGTDNAAADVETVDLNGGVTEETAAAESDNTDTNVSNVDSDILTGKKTTEKVLPQSSGGTDVTVYFANNPGWENVYMYEWASNSNGFFREMQLESGLLWKITLDYDIVKDNKFCFAMAILVAIHQKLLI